MSQSSLKVFIIAADAQQGAETAALLSNKGVDAGSLGVADTPDSDAQITTLVKSKNWDGYVVGKPIQQNKEWFERIKNLVKSANSNAAFVDPKSRDDLENAVERHFNVKLPITKA